MNRFVLRLLVTLIVLYGLGAVAYGLLHYPAGERPDVPGVLGDFTSDLADVFRRKEPARVPSGPVSSRGPVEEHLAGGLATETRPAGSSSLDALKGDAHYSLALAKIEIPDPDRLPASAAAMWDDLRPIHARVLPDAIEELRRLRTLATTDKAAFERDRAANRDRLATARKTLLPHTEAEPPLPAAVALLEVLDRLDAEFARL